MQYKCKRCKYIWTAKVAVPKSCPRCKGYMIEKV
ncbi:MAG: hypothetical protein ACXWPS_08105 [Ktedonobacteraceae bacterium]